VLETGLTLLNDKEEMVAQPRFEFPGDPSRDHRRTDSGACPQAGILARLDYGPFGADKHSSL